MERDRLLRIVVNHLLNGTEPEELREHYRRWMWNDADADRLVDRALKEVNADILRFKKICRHVDYLTRSHSERGARLTVTDHFKTAKQLAGRHDVRPGDIAGEMSQYMPDVPLGEITEIADQVLKEYERCRQDTIKEVRAACQRASLSGADPKDEIGRLYEPSFGRVLPVEIDEMIQQVQREDGQD